jgi:hypothetical protein
LDWGDGRVGSMGEATTARAVRFDEPGELVLRWVGDVREELEAAKDELD